MMRKPACWWKRWLLPVAAIWLFGITDSPTSHMGEEPWSLNLLLIPLRAW